MLRSVWHLHLYKFVQVVLILKYEGALIIILFFVIKTPWVDKTPYKSSFRRLNNTSMRKVCARWSANYRLITNRPVIHSTIGIRLVNCNPSLLTNDILKKSMSIHIHRTEGAIIVDVWQQADWLLLWSDTVYIAQQRLFLLHAFNWFL